MLFVLVPLVFLMLIGPSTAYASDGEKSAKAQDNTAIAETSPEPVSASEPNPAPAAEPAPVQAPSQSVPEPAPAAPTDNTPVSSSGSSSGQESAVDNVENASSGEQHAEAPQPAGDNGEIADKTAVEYGKTACEDNDQELVLDTEAGSAADCDAAEQEVDARSGDGVPVEVDESNAEPQPTDVSNAQEQNESSQAKALAAAASDSNKGDKSTSGSDNSGKITHYDSHKAELTYSAAAGGAVRRDSSDESADSVVECYNDSLSGRSKGVTAVADEGYYFVHWIDTRTGEVVSTEATLVPERPEEGWPDAWEFRCIFLPGTYVVVLDPNGGKITAVGDETGDVVRIEVTPGSDYQLPENGSEDLSVSNTGYRFDGWYVSKDPDSGVTSASTYVKDGQTLDSDWFTAECPTLTFFAKWLYNQASITYRAETGGEVSLNSSKAGTGASYLKESIDADTGENIDSSVASGANGASASASARYHFDGWKATGGTVALTDEESSSTSISADTVARLSRNANGGATNNSYHDVSFTASFKPNTYVLSYEANGGTGDVSSASVAYGSKIKAASAGVSRDGYTLAGWNLKPDGSGVSVELGASIDSSKIDSMIASGSLSDFDSATTTLYAQWTEAKPQADGSSSQQDSSAAGSKGSSKVKGSSSANASSGKKDSGSKKKSKSSKTLTKSKSASQQEGRTSGSQSPVAQLVEFAADAVAPTVEALDSAVEETANTATQAVSDIVEQNADKLGKLASSVRNASSLGPVVLAEGYEGGSSATAGSNGDDAMSSLMSPEGVQTAGTMVAVVAVVGAIAGFVGLGVSAASAAAVGAVAIGASGAAGAAGAVDLVADLAAAGAAGAAGAAARRRKDEDEDDV